MVTAGLVVLAAGLLGCSRDTTVESSASSSQSLPFGADELEQLRGAVMGKKAGGQEWASVSPGSRVSVKPGMHILFLGLVGGLTDVSQVSLTSSDERVVKTDVSVNRDGSIVLYGQGVNVGTATVSATSPLGTATFAVDVAP